jgi:hydrogenase maturation protease
MNPVLVIGYGNTLRGDDGAGVIAAGRARDLVEGVDVVTTHQLQPEHAEAVAGHRCVLFVDASVGRHTLGVTEIWSRERQPHGSTHTLSPAGLLTLAQEVFGKNPERSLLLEIPALSMEFGDGLTPETSACVEEALVHIRHEAELFLNRV